MLICLYPTSVHDSHYNRHIFIPNILFTKSLSYLFLKVYILMIVNINDEVLCYPSPLL